MKRQSLDVGYSLWRSYVPPPAPIKPEIPGWAGARDANRPQPWMCKPWLDAATYGGELRWGLRCEVTVTSAGGRCLFDGDFRAETGAETFGEFAPGHFGVNTHLRLRTPKGWGMMVLPHPRWFLDPQGSQLPLIIPGILEFDWWPNAFFVVCRTPRPGEKCVFRHGEPYCQVIPVPLELTCEFRELAEEEHKEIAREELIVRERYFDLSETITRMANGKTFGDVYKVLSREFRKRGAIDWNAVEATVDRGSGKWTFGPRPADAEPSSHGGPTPDA